MSVCGYPPETGTVPEQDNPSMHRETITISGYPAVQFEGKSRVADGYYDRKQVLIGGGDTCFLIDITGRDNPEQWTLLNEILSTFKFING